MTDNDTDAKAHTMPSRRFPPPWQDEQIPGGFKVLDASGQALASSTHERHASKADIAKVLTFDDARRIAINVAKLSELLRESRS
jgi:hypothetical protein